MADDFVVRRDLNGVPVHGYDRNTDLVKTLMYLWDTTTLSPVLATNIPGTGAIAAGNVALTTRVDDQTDASYIYIGKAAIGSSEDAAVWQIQRLPKSGIVKSLYAGGNENYDNVWSNRKNLSYS
jgi:hypothetical protein